MIFTEEIFREVVIFANFNQVSVDDALLDDAPLTTYQPHVHAALQGVDLITC